MEDHIAPQSDSVSFKVGMPLEEKIQSARCFWHLVARDAITGEIVWEEEKENLIVTVGKGLILDRVFGLSAVAAIAGMAIGTNATAAAVGDTTITGAVYQAFDATPVRSSLTVTATTTFGTGTGNITINEVGLLTASGGTLLNHLAPVGPFTKTSAVTLAVSVQVVQA